MLIWLLNTTGLSLKYLRNVALLVSSGVFKPFKWSLERINISQTTIVKYIIIHDNSLQCFSYLQELTFLVPIRRIKSVLNSNSWSLGNYFWESTYNWVVDCRNKLAENLIKSQFQSEEEFTDQRSSHFKLCIVINLKSLKKKSAPIFDLSFDTVLTKFKLFHVVEKIYHARQTFEINCDLWIRRKVWYLIEQRYYCANV